MERFGWNERRRDLLDGQEDARELLAAVGCRRVWLNGSFVTAKDEPGDFDACWNTDGVDLAQIDPVFLDLVAGRAAQKSRFGGEFFPNVVEAAVASCLPNFSRMNATVPASSIVVVKLGGPP
jgi:hypothetical protein